MRIGLWTMEANAVFFFSGQALSSRTWLWAPSPSFSSSFGCQRRREGHWRRYNFRFAEHWASVAKILRVFFSLISRQRLVSVEQEFLGILLNVHKFSKVKVTEFFSVDTTECCDKYLTCKCWNSDSYHIALFLPPVMQDQQCIVKVYVKIGASALAEQSQLPKQACWGLLLYYLLFSFIRRTHQDSNFKNLWSMI